MNNAAKTVPRILRDNICTGFNALNLMIALVLAAVGAWRNLLFLFIILINTTVGIVQEIRAKRQIERLTLLLAAAVMRGGKEQRIRPEELRKVTRRCWPQGMPSAPTAFGRKGGRRSTKPSRPAAAVLTVVFPIGQSLLNLCLTVSLLGLITKISEWKQIF